MPFEQRVVHPIACGRGCVPMDQMGQLAIAIPNELECVTNGTLANIIRQLSSLSRFAEDLFAAILADASLLVVRAADLQARIERLGDKVVGLDSSVEEVSLQDIHLRKAFKSHHAFDQQVVARHTIPANILAVYRQCDRPPPLSKLNPYREDGKDGLKFYTDPNYFFELWRQEMLADTEKVLLDKTRKAPQRKAEAKKQRKAVRAPNNSRERFRQMASNQGEFILEAHAEPARPSSLEVRQEVPPEVLFHNQYNREQNFDARQREPQRDQATPTRRAPTLTSRPSQPPPAPPSAPSSGPSTPAHAPSRSNVRETLPPPPPPPPEVALNGERDANRERHAQRDAMAMMCMMEPPPPPPPPPSSAGEHVGPTWHSSSAANSTNGSRPAEPTEHSSQARDERSVNVVNARELQSVTLKKTPTQEKTTDARSDLLQAIREGIKLKRVEDCKQREVEKSTPLHDVASILARRVAIELSDSEREDEEESDAWDDESEC